MTRRVLTRLLRNWGTALLVPIPLAGVRHLPRYVRDWVNYGRRPGGEALRIRDSQPCLGDWTSNTPFDPHYFYQGAWLARRLALAQPDLHVDISSSVLSIGVLSAAVPTVFLDYRPLKAPLANLASVVGDLRELPFADGAIHSLSCLHVVEHIGLGRYGDRIDPEGSRDGVIELGRVLAPGGDLYVSAPVGRERVCFNAHRVFAPDRIPRWLSHLRLLEFSWVDDAGQLREEGVPQHAHGAEYACGLYRFRK